MKIIDQIYTLQFPHQQSDGWSLHCHLDIFLANSNAHVVMISDMGFEIGWFNPHIIEQLAEQVVQEFHLNPVKLVWLEHYSADKREPHTTEFSQVTFDWHTGKASNPQWSAIAPDFVQTLLCEDLQLQTV